MRLDAREGRVGKTRMLHTLDLGEMARTFSLHAWRASQNYPILANFPGDNFFLLFLAQLFFFASHQHLSPRSNWSSAMPMEMILANNVLCGTALTLLPAIHSSGSASSPHSIATIGRDSRLHNSQVRDYDASHFKRDILSCKRYGSCRKIRIQGSSKTYNSRHHQSWRNEKLLNENYEEAIL